MMALIGVMGLTQAGEGSAEYRLREHLGRRWANQRVTYGLEAPRGACAPGAVRLRGAAGPLPAQLSEVELWPDTDSVKSARLSFVVAELKPLSENLYTVTWDKAAGASLPAADLTAERTEGEVKLATSRFGARFVLGEETYAPPRAAAELPGPVARMRLAGGTWFGGSRLYGEGKVTARSARLTADGPVFARVETVYTYADGNTLTVACELTAGDDALWVDMVVGRDAAPDGWELLLDGASAGDRAVLLSGRSGGHARELEVNLKEVTPVLSAWSGSGWFPHGPEAIRLPLDGDASGELHLVARDRGAWVTPPAERPWWGNLNNWGRGSAGWIWMPRDRKGIPVSSTAAGALMRISLLAGNRHWSVGHAADPTPLRETFFRRAFTTMNAPVATLDEVKDRILAWPDGTRQRPFIFIDRAELDAAAEQDRAAYDALLNVNGLRGALDNPSLDFVETDPAGARNLHGYLGDFGAVHSPAFAVAARYDAIMGTEGVLSTEERALLRAKLAYTAYETALPHNWSLERGYVSGNPNMSVSLVVKIGLLGIALYDHPMGPQWAQYAADWVQYWLDETVNEGGVWPESSNYGRHGYSLILKFAIAARHAGVADFFKHPKLMRMVEYYEKTLTPPDPLRLTGDGAPARVNPIYGRGVRGDMHGLGGVAARAFADSAPEFASALRWSWRECHFHKGFGWDRTADAMDVYTRSQQEGPFRVPDWRSEHIPARGYLLRSHLGLPGENYLYFISHYFRCQDSELHPWDTGAIVKWFAGGTPVGGSFINLPGSNRMALTCRVLLASNLDPEAGLWPVSDYDTRATQVASAFLPGLDYADAKFNTFRFLGRKWGPEPKDAPTFPRRERVGEAPFTWRRQLLLAADDDPDGVNYLVLRDTVSGGQPTQWHFWTLSEKLGTPEQAADRTAFLADAPGAAVAPARELKGDRFTALGQFDKDIDYYVASPADSPRYTLRYGITGGAGGVRNFSEFQDLLHLQREDDGVYFVAIFPRGKDEPSPRFDTLGEGRVIRITGTFGEDHTLLSEVPVEVDLEDFAFKGTASAVRQRATGMHLVLGAAGEARCGDYAIAADEPAALHVGSGVATLTRHAAAGKAEIRLTLPGTWSVTEKASASLDTRDGHHVLTLPEGIGQTTMRRDH